MAKKLPVITFKRDFEGLMDSFYVHKVERRRRAKAKLPLHRETEGGRTHAPTDFPSDFPIPIAYMVPGLALASLLQLSTMYFVDFLPLVSTMSSLMISSLKNF